MNVDRIAKILSLPLSVFIGLFLLWPVFSIVGGGFFDEGNFTLRHFVAVLENSVYTEGMFNSLILAAGTTVLCLIFAFPLAWVIHFYEFRGRKFFSALILVPMVLPPFVGAIGMVKLFGPYGAVNALLGCGPVDWLSLSEYGGVVFLQALCFYPVVYLNVSSALANVDPAMDEAARNLGAGLATRIRRIVLPLILPGVFAGCTIVFIAAFTELGTPLIMNFTRCSAVQVYDALKEIHSGPFAYALVSVLLLGTVTLYALGVWCAGKREYSLQNKAARQHAPLILHGWRALMAVAPFAIVSMLALLPHLGVIFTSVCVPGTWYQSVLPGEFTFRNYATALGQGMSVSAIKNSLLFAAGAVGINILIGTGIAWINVRSNLRCRKILDTAAMIPLAVPGLVMAFGYISVSSTICTSELVKSSELLQEMLDVRKNPSLFLIIAYAVRRIPYMVRAVTAGLQQTPPALEEAAANLGASPLMVIRRVTLPLIFANIIAGALLVFAFSMLEVSDSLMLAQKAQYYPVTKAIFEMFQLVGSGQYTAAALGVWAMLLLILALVGAGIAFGEKAGAVFKG